MLYLVKKNIPNLVMSMGLFECDLVNNKYGIFK